MYNMPQKIPVARYQALIARLFSNPDVGNCQWFTQSYAVPAVKDRKLKRVRRYRKCGITYYLNPSS